MCHDGRVPDWTYHPLRRPMGALLGVRRSRLAALGLVGALARYGWGRWLVAGLGHTSPPRDAAGVIAGTRCVSRVGASVGLGAARDALSALPALGAGLIEIGPLSRDSVEELVRVLEGARVPVVVRTADDDGSARELLEQVRTRVSVPVVDPLVIREATPAAVKQGSASGRSVVAATSDASSANVANLIAAGAAAVLATPAALIDAGPGWFHRATLAYLARLHSGEPAAPAPLWTWTAGLGLGLGMIAGGIGAAAVAFGPVLLPYDRSFLGVDATDLAAVNPRLIQFLQHDRITLAGTMVAIGILYSGLSWWGIHAGRVWARNALLASGLVGFPTLFYFFAYQYVEPIHVALAVVLFPLFVLATWRTPSGGTHEFEGEGPATEWRRALIGQLLMVSVGAGLVIGGVTISYVGLTAVFVPSDLSYMSTSAQALAAANHRLLSFIAHDRAGFGGALISVGVAAMLMSSWGWARGQAWVWWSLAGGATAGFGAALAIHLGVWYVDFWHLAPIYAGSAVTAIGLALSWSFLAAPRRVVRAPVSESASASSPSR